MLGTGTLFGARLFQWLVIDSLTQFFTRLEMRNAFFWNQDLIARLGIAASACRTMMQYKTANATQLNALTSAKA